MREVVEEREDEERLDLMEEREYLVPIPRGDNHEVDQVALA
jgi:hypothetical protein